MEIFSYSEQLKKWMEVGYWVSGLVAGRDLFGMVAAGSMLSPAASVCVPTLRRGAAWGVVRCWAWPSGVGYHLSACLCCM